MRSKQVIISLWKSTLLIMAALFCFRLPISAFIASLLSDNTILLLLKSAISKLAGIFWYVTSWLLTLTVISTTISCGCPNIGWIGYLGTGIETLTTEPTSKRGDASLYKIYIWLFGLKFENIYYKLFAKQLMLLG